MPIDSRRSRPQPKRGSGRQGDSNRRYYSNSDYETGADSDSSASRTFEDDGDRRDDGEEKRGSVGNTKHSKQSRTTKASESKQSETRDTLGEHRETKILKRNSRPPRKGRSIFGNSSAGRSRRRTDASSVGGSSYSQSDYDYEEGFDATCMDALFPRNAERKMNMIRCDQTGPSATEVQLKMTLPLSLRGMDQLVPSRQELDTALESMNCKGGRNRFSKKCNFDYRQLEHQVLEMEQRLQGASLPIFYKSLFESASEGSTDEDCTAAARSRSSSHDKTKETDRRQTEENDAKSREVENKETVEDPEDDQLSVSDIERPPSLPSHILVGDLSTEISSEEGIFGPEMAMERDRSMLAGKPAHPLKDSVENQSPSRKKALGMELLSGVQNNNEVDKEEPSRHGLSRLIGGNSRQRFPSPESKKHNWSPHSREVPSKGQPLAIYTQRSQPSVCDPQPSLDEGAPSPQNQEDIDGYLGDENNAFNPQVSKRSTSPSKTRAIVTNNRSDPAPEWIPAKKEQLNIVDQEYPSFDEKGGPLSGGPSASLAKRELKVEMSTVCTPFSIPSTVQDNDRELGTIHSDLTHEGDDFINKPTSADVGPSFDNSEHAEEKSASEKIPSSASHEAKAEQETVAPIDDQPQIASPSRKMDPLPRTQVPAPSLTLENSPAKLSECVEESAIPRRTGDAVIAPKGESVCSKPHVSNENWDNADACNEGVENKSSDDSLKISFSGSDDESALLAAAIGSIDSGTMSQQSASQRTGTVKALANEANEESVVPKKGSESEKLFENLDDLRLSNSESEAKLKRGVQTVILGKENNPSADTTPSGANTAVASSMKDEVMRFISSEVNPTKAHGTSFPHNPCSSNCDHPSPMLNCCKGSSAESESAEWQGQGDARTEDHTETDVTFSPEDMDDSDEMYKIQMDQLTEAIEVENAMQPAQANGDQSRPHNEHLSMAELLSKYSVDTFAQYCKKLGENRFQSPAESKANEKLASILADSQSLLQKRKLSNLSLPPTKDVSVQAFSQSIRNLDQDNIRLSIHAAKVKSNCHEPSLTNAPTTETPHTALGSYYTTETPIASAPSLASFESHHPGSRGQKEESKGGRRSLHEGNSASEYPLMQSMQPCSSLKAAVLLHEEIKKENSANVAQMLLVTLLSAKCNLVACVLVVMSWLAHFWSGALWRAAKGKGRRNLAPKSSSPNFMDFTISENIQPHFRTASSTRLLEDGCALELVIPGVHTPTARGRPPRWTVFLPAPTKHPSLSEKQTNSAVSYQHSSS